MVIKFNVIAAVCEGGGIGHKGQLPWKLKNEMAFFTKMTSQLPPGSEGKKNVVIMGRKTWDSIPPKYKPLPNRINVVISSTMGSSQEGDNKDALVFRSLSSALSALELPPYSDMYADIWMIGGSYLYKESVQLPTCHRLYITNILKSFDCDTFFPPIPERFNLIKVEDVPEGKQTENGIEYEFKVYEASVPAPS